MKAARSRRTPGRSLALAAVATLATLGGLPDLSAQELLLQEGFNTDGEAASPKRYTMSGRELYEPDRIRDVLGNFDQKGPISRRQPPPTPATPPSPDAAPSSPGAAPMLPALPRT